MEFILLIKPKRKRELGRLQSNLTAFQDTATKRRNGTIHSFKDNTKEECLVVTLKRVMVR